MRVRWTKARATGPPPSLHSTRPCTTGSRVVSTRKRSSGANTSRRESPSTSCPACRSSQCVGGSCSSPAQLCARPANVNAPLPSVVVVRLWAGPLNRARIASGASGSASSCVGTDSFSTMPAATATPSSNTCPATTRPFPNCTTTSPRSSPTCLCIAWKPGACTSTPPAIGRAVNATQPSASVVAFSTSPPCCQRCTVAPAIVCSRASTTRTTNGTVAAARTTSVRGVAVSAGVETVATVLGASCALAVVSSLSAASHHVDNNKSSSAATRYFFIRNRGNRTAARVAKVAGLAASNACVHACRPPARWSKCARSIAMARWMRCRTMAGEVPSRAAIARGARSSKKRSVTAVR